MGVHSDDDAVLGPPDNAWGARVGQRVVYDAKVVEGRDGYLFMADDNNEVLAQHSGERRLTDVQLEDWRRVLEQRTELLAQHGCGHLVLVAPNNHSVYPEKLPEGVESAPERPVHQLMTYLAAHNSPVKLIYPLDELLAAKSEHQVCSRIDSHWTDYGAFLAYERLMRDARKLVPTRAVEEDDVLFVDIEINGDLGEKLDPPRVATQGLAQMRSRAARLLYDNCVEGTGALAVTDCPPAPPTTCLLVGDSYCYFLVTFLSECWRRLVVAHSPNLDPGVVRAAQPDIAVTVIAERFLVTVPDELNGPTMEQREQEKRAYDRTRYPLMYWYWPSFLSATPVEAIRARLVSEGRTRDAALVSLIAYAGLRPAEAMALRWSAVGESSIAVEPLPSRAAAGAAVREVPLWKPVADDLEAWRQESGGAGRRLIFTAPSQPWAVNLQEWRDQIYPDLARAAGLDDHTVAYLRNAFCVLLIDAGEPLEHVSELTDVDVAELEKSFAMLLSDPRRRPVPPEEAIAKARTEASPGPFL